MSNSSTFLFRGVDLHAMSIVSCFANRLNARTQRGLSA